MQFYDVQGCKALIVKPGMTLTEWANKNKPFAVCNASLYDMNTKVPIGTIYENGVLVHNDGNGYGYGVVKSEPAFGNPWERRWDDYITGYNTPVQNGAYIAPAYKDDYVFNVKNVRIAIGELKGRLTIITDDNVTLKQFANNAIAAGVTILVNLDGGGSRHLYYNGRTIYKSYRVPYNALAFYKEGHIVTEYQEQYPEPTRNLWYGCVGEDVKWVQQKLNKHGFHCMVDGKYFFETFRQVWNFQKTWTNRPDGITGPNTRGKLKE